MSALDQLFTELASDSRDLEFDFGADLAGVPSWQNPAQTLPPDHGLDWPGLATQSVAPPLGFPPSVGDSQEAVESGVQSHLWSPDAQLQDFPAQEDDFRLPVGFEPPDSSGGTIPPSELPELPTFAGASSVETPEQLQDPQQPAQRTRRTNAASRNTARQNAKVARENEKAEKLKEKNKRAQRKFRQRQKDRQETAEKLAADLADELKTVRLQNESLEARNRQLEHCIKASSVTMPDPDNAEGSGESFVPALGFNPGLTTFPGEQFFDAHKGIKLVAVTNMDLSHSQLMKMSLRDVSKFLAESVRQLGFALTELDRDPGSAHALNRIQAIIDERRGMFAYIATHKPQAINQIFAAKMVDPPEENVPAPGLEFWAKCTEGVILSEQQANRVVSIRKHFLRKVDQLLQQRDELRKALTDRPLYPGALDVPSMHTHHLRWATVLDKLRENTELMEKAHMFFMQTISEPDCIDKEHMARIAVRASPWQINLFAVSRMLIEDMGLPNHVETILAERLRKEEGPSPVDLFLASIPAWEGQKILEEHEGISKGTASGSDASTCSGSLAGFFTQQASEKQ